MLGLVVSLGGASSFSPTLLFHSSVSGVFPAGSCIREPLFQLVKVECFIFLLSVVIRRQRRVLISLQLTDKLLQAVLAEAQVVCIGQPLLIAGDLEC